MSGAPTATTAPSADVVWSAAESDGDAETFWRALGAALAGLAEEAPREASPA